MTRVRFLPPQHKRPTTVVRFEDGRVVEMTAYVPPLWLSRTEGVYGVLTRMCREAMKLETP